MFCRIAPRLFLVIVYHVAFYLTAVPLSDNSPSPTHTHAHAKRLFGLIGVGAMTSNTIYYSYAPYNDVSVSDRPHIQQWSHKIVI